MRRGPRERQCYGKIKHKNRAQAKKVAKRMGNTQVGRLNVYLCPWCHKYHVGKVENRNGEKSN